MLRFSNRIAGKLMSESRRSACQRRRKTGPITYPPQRRPPPARNRCRRCIRRQGHLFRGRRGGVVISASVARDMINRSVDELLHHEHLQIADKKHEQRRTGCGEEGQADTHDERHRFKTTTRDTNNVVHGHPTTSTAPSVRWKNVK